MLRVLDMARIRKREEQKKAAETRTDFPGSDLREAVLLGVADEWPAPDLGEVIEAGGRIRAVGSLSVSECIEATGQLIKAIAPIGKRLKVSMTEWVPERPLRADDFELGDRGFARQLNSLCLVLRAVRRQREILEAGVAAHARKERDLTLLAKQRLLDESPAALARVSKSLEGMDDAVSRIEQFISDVRLVASAPELIRFAQRLRDTAEKAGAKGLPDIPSLNEGTDPIFALRLAKALGVLPIVPNERDYEMANAGRAAIARDAKE